MISNSCHFDLNAVQKQASKAVREVGKGVLHAFTAKQFGAPQFKLGQEIFTETDLWAEQQLKSKLLGILPGSSIIGEEEHSSVPTSELRQRVKDEELIWVVDPIDGTNNFCNLIPHFSVSVALIVKGEIQLALIYDPNRDELYHAQKDCGAFRNETLINPSSIDSLSNSIVSFYFPVKHQSLTSFWTQIERAIVRARASRSHGCATLDICWVASGRLQVALMNSLHLWDLAAASLVASEAGVKSCNYPHLDLELDLFGSCFVFASPTLWPALTETVLV